MADKDLQDLFYNTLRDMYYAEKHILKTLPKLRDAAQAEELKEAFETHHAETEHHIERLDQVFEILGRKPTSKRCDAIDGILKEGDANLEEFSGTPAGDAALIASAQAVEHYEITRYGTLRRWATVLGLSEAADLLSATLDEEAHADELLTEIADSESNEDAKRASE